MKKIMILCLAFFVMGKKYLPAQSNYDKHPETSGKGWTSLFNDNLTNSIDTKGVWSINDGVITASEDEALWSEKKYDDFILDLEFKNADSTNSGVIVHASDIKNWIPNSVEIQIADDYSEIWSKASPSWQCAAIFGHQAAVKRAVKKPGEWNRYTITCKGKKIWVVLNGELVNECDMSLYGSAKTNPDGSEIPSWLSNPLTKLPLHGHIGFQGKHAGAPIYFRNIRIKEIRPLSPEGGNREIDVQVMRSNGGVNNFVNKTYLLCKRIIANPFRIFFSYGMASEPFSALYYNFSHRQKWGSVKDFLLEE